MKKFTGVLLIIVLFSFSSCIFGKSVKKVMSYRNGHVYFTDRETYKVGELSGAWKKMRVKTYSIAFHNAGAGATIATDAFCGPAYEDIPLKALTSHLLAGVDDYVVERSEEFTLDERGALRTIARGSVDGVPLTFDVVVIKKNRCMIDLMCIAPEGRHNDVVADFEGFYGAFHYE